MSEGGGKPASGDELTGKTIRRNAARTGAADSLCRDPERLMNYNPAYMQRDVARTNFFVMRPRAKFRRLTLASTRSISLEPRAEIN